MNKPHPKAVFIKAKADGETIQYWLGKWHDMKEDDWEFPIDGEYRIKPPAPKWPETTMQAKELSSIYAKYHGTVADAFLAVANATLAHALETGQVVLPKKSFSDVSHMQNGGAAKEGSGFGVLDKDWNKP